MTECYGNSSVHIHLIKIHDMAWQVDINLYHAVCSKFFAHLAVVVSKTVLEICSSP